jgi:hypothetical protein
LHQQVSILRASINEPATAHILAELTIIHGFPELNEAHLEKHKKLFISFHDIFRVVVHFEQDSQTFEASRENWKHTKTINNAHHDIETKKMS